MRFRNLRIAWSVVCGIVCLLLIALYLRSYSCEDRLRGTWLEAWSAQGQLALSIGDLGLPWKITTEQVRHRGWHKPGLGWSVTAKTTFVIASHQTLAVLTAMVAALPWLPWRFSLRTLLIVMTLIAGGLGVVVWATGD